MSQSLEMFYSFVNLTDCSMKGIETEHNLQIDISPHSNSLQSTRHVPSNLSK